MLAHGVQATHTILLYDLVRRKALSRYNFAKILSSHTLLLNLQPIRVSSSCLLSTRAFRTKHVCLWSHSACFIGKLFNQTMLEHHHKLNSLSAHVCMQQILTNAVTYYSTYLVLRYDQYRLITPPPPFQGRRQCRKLQRTILPRTTNRHECRHPLPYSSLRSSPVNYAPPAL